jgi:hypothetical protein
MAVLWPPCFVNILDGLSSSGACMFDRPCQLSSELASRDQRFSMSRIPHDICHLQSFLGFPSRSWTALTSRELRSCVYTSRSLPAVCARTQSGIHNVMW